MRSNPAKNPNTSTPVSTTPGCVESLATTKPKDHSSSNWPPLLQEFVTRCYLVTTMSPEILRILSAQLLEILQLALDKDVLHTNSWDDQTIPILDGGDQVKLVGSITDIHERSLRENAVTSVSRLADLVDAEDVAELSLNAEDEKNTQSNDGCTSKPGSCASLEKIPDAINVSKSELLEQIIESSSALDTDSQDAYESAREAQTEVVYTDSRNLLQNSQDSSDDDVIIIINQLTDLSRKPTTLRAALNYMPIKPIEFKNKVKSPFNNSSSTESEEVSKPIGSNTKLPSNGLVKGKSIPDPLPSSPPTRTTSSNNNPKNLLDRVKGPPSKLKRKILTSTASGAASVVSPSSKASRKSKYTDLLQDYYIDESPDTAPAVITTSSPRNDSLKRPADFDSEDRKRQRAQRFVTGNNPAPLSSATRIETGPKRAVRGTCQELEKSYLRLTSEPDPARVRPELVLKRASKRFYDRYLLDDNYLYFIDQFKSIRQDLTVQNIRNLLAIEIYEKNARVLILNNDMGEFNQCQSQLQELYHACDEDMVHNQVEFFAYRVLYMIMTNNDSAMAQCRADYLKHTSTNDKNFTQQPWLGFLPPLFQFYVAFKMCDYSTIFALYRSFQAEGTLLARLLETHIIPIVRVRSISVMVQAYRKLSLQMISDLLGFAVEKQVIEFLNELGIRQHVTSDGKLDCSLSRLHLKLHAQVK